MVVYSKYLILINGIIAAITALKNGNIGSGIAATGAFVAFAVIEVQDLKIANKEEE